MKLDGKTVTEGLKLAVGNERQGDFGHCPAQKAHPVSTRASRGRSASPGLHLPEQRALGRLAGPQGDIFLPHKTPILLLFKPSLCRCPLAFCIIAGASIYAYSSSLINSLHFLSLWKNSSPSGKAVPPDRSFAQTDPSQHEEAPSQLHTAPRTHTGWGSAALSLLPNFGGPAGLGVLCQPSPRYRKARRKREQDRVLSHYISDATTIPVVGNPEAAGLCAG